MSLFVHWNMKNSWWKDCKLCYTPNRLGKYLAAASKVRSSYYIFTVPYFIFHFKIHFLFHVWDFETIPHTLVHRNQLTNLKKKTVRIFIGIIFKMIKILSRFESSYLTSNQTIKLSNHKLYKIVLKNYSIF